mmetsp:Transcript_19135/g.73194  ORF Transcript_19135/g.73194 Transcript_19135/m.73194 type:complete len:234 (-) Transcript_19135:715-1416(-)
MSARLRFGTSISFRTANAAGWLSACIARRRLWERGSCRSFGVPSSGGASGRGVPVRTSSRRRDCPWSGCRDGGWHWRGKPANDRPLFVVFCGCCRGHVNRRLQSMQLRAPRQLATDTPVRLQATRSGPIPPVAVAAGAGVVLVRRAGCERPFQPGQLREGLLHKPPKAAQQGLRRVVFLVQRCKRHPSTGAGVGVVTAAATVAAQARCCCASMLVLEQLEQPFHDCATHLIGC